MNTTLRITHNAGFFSCSSIALQDLMIHFNEHRALPEQVDRFVQYALYKKHPLDNLIPFFFKETDRPIPWTGRADITLTGFQPQFSPYSMLEFEKVAPFVERYFQPSDRVAQLAAALKSKYALDTENLCAVFYRGNDKGVETPIAPYAEFIAKAKAVRAACPGIRFLVQPDETEFLEAFLAAFPDAIHFTETPHIKKAETTVFYTLPQAERRDYAATFFAAVTIISQAKVVITHSGNCGLWAVLYRGHAGDVHQWLGDRWC